MQNELKVALIQSDLVWENPEQNRILFSKKIATISDAIDLIVLPEMFTTGFTMNASSTAETMDGKTLQWMQQIAKKKQVAITGSIIIFENKCYYNRLFFVFPNGNYNHYDKRHLFTLAGEEKVFTAGKKRLTLVYKGWKICPLICYDLRFPVWSRNSNSYDVLIYVANWPKQRIEAWNTLLKSRSIENMTYTIGVNRTGTDELKHQYTGNSVAIDFFGKTMVNFEPEQQQIKLVTLYKKDLEATRTKLGFLKDQDSFKINTQSH